MALEISRAIPPSDTSNSARRFAAYHRRCSDLLRSEWLLASGHGKEALAAVPRKSPSDLSSRPGFLAGFTGRFEMTVVIPVMLDIIPRAHLALGQVDSSVVWYERAVSQAAVPDRPIFPRYPYRLAQVYERKGLILQAVAEYEKFLKIWGSADAVYNEPEDARARLAKLKRTL